MIIAKTNRLILSELSIEDADWFFELNNDDEVLKYTGDSPFESVLSAKTFLADYNKCYEINKMGRWAVKLIETNETLGWCGLKLHKNQNVDLGFRFFKRFWNKGYATEAALASLKYGFNELGLDQIIANAQTENAASHKVIQKLSFKKQHEFVEDGVLWVQYHLRKTDFSNLIY